MDWILILLGASALIFAVAAWLDKSLTDLGLALLALAFFLDRL